ncbi:HsdM family class I SAM-dependent methyltransferase [Neolewinella litorea]|uniref:site-specific DNA-methyltransferase (adenine-specific) n=1 Tax=Neolewinella litorea TaxID=2562452 RepID=A0A4S4N8B1_9BACT|nr:class I SAM-dependent DNA methyltransferase [Neolewinella litorea]THH34577.1 SAM-dependent DNA methyltransferase [Neolewinella litorea]
MMYKKKTAAHPGSVGASLWNRAEKLRGEVDRADYQHALLTLVFLKWADVRYAARHLEMSREGLGGFLDQADFYNAENVFYLPEEGRWSSIAGGADTAARIDQALSAMAACNPMLEGELPDRYFTALGLTAEQKTALLQLVDGQEATTFQEGTIGEVFDYLLDRFGTASSRTPACLVGLMVDLLEPLGGKLYDPCCGTGHTLVRSVDFARKQHGKYHDLRMYGQESAPATRWLARMSLSVHGVDARLGAAAASVFGHDQHPEVAADYVLAHPPAGEDPYAWIQHVRTKLNEGGTAALMLADRSLRSRESKAATVRRRLLEEDVVDCLIALPANLGCLWLLSHDKLAEHNTYQRDRPGETLFIQAESYGHSELSQEAISRIADTYHQWRDGRNDYEDVPGFCRSVTLAEIAGNDYDLSPNRYAAAPVEGERSGRLAQVE